MATASVPLTTSANTPFPSPFRTDDDSFTMERIPRSLVELAMARMSAAIRNKPNWRTKRHDPHITSKWTREAAAIDPLLTPAAIQYVLDELSYYDQLLDTDSGIEQSVVDGVWQSDHLLSDDLIQAVRHTVQQCWGHESSAQRDWHPGSGQQVWDILHPSLYCLVAGRTQVVDADDIPLERSMAMMGAGRVLGVAEYGRQLEQRMAAFKVQGDRWQHRYPTHVDSDDEAAMEQQQVEAEKKTADVVAAESVAAWREGLIAVTVQLLSHTSKRGPSRGIAVRVFVKPDANMRDVRTAIAAHWPAMWRPSWTLTRKDDKPLPSDDSETPLYALGIRSTILLIATEATQVEDERAKAETKRARAALRPVRITVTTERGAHISLHRLDQSATVATLMQQLSGGMGDVQGGCYPSFARGVAVSEQRLYVSDRYTRYRKRLLPHNTLAHYQLRNGDKRVLLWSRVTEADGAAEDGMTEVRVQPLLSAKMTCIWLDAQRGATVGWMKQQLVAGLLPQTNRYNPLPVADCRLFFPATTEHELTDDSRTIASLVSENKQQQQQQPIQFGVRWQGDDKAKAADDEEDEDGATQGENAANTDTSKRAPQQQVKMQESANSEQPDDVDMKQEDVKQESSSEQAGSAEATTDGDDGCEKELLIFTNPGRQRLRVRVKSSMTVRELKERIMLGQVEAESSARAKTRTQGVSVAQQQLTYSNHSGEECKLRDKRTLGFYDLMQGGFGADNFLTRQLQWKQTQAEQQQQSGEEAGHSGGGGREERRGYRPRACRRQCRVIVQQRSRRRQRTGAQCAHLAC